MGVEVVSRSSSVLVGRWNLEVRDGCLSRRSGLRSGPVGETGVRGPERVVVRLVVWSPRLDNGRRGPRSGLGHQGPKSGWVDRVHRVRDVVEDIGVLTSTVDT